MPAVFLPCGGDERLLAIPKTPQARLHESRRVVGAATDPRRALQSLHALRHRVLEMRQVVTLQKSAVGGHGVSEQGHLVERGRPPRAVGGPTNITVVPGSASPWRFCRSRSRKLDFPAQLGPARTTRLPQSTGGGAAQPPPRPHIELPDCHRRIAHQWRLRMGEGADRRARLDVAPPSPNRSLIGHERSLARGRMV
jgi:hypothetical protein